MTYNDTTVGRNTTYFYRVVANNLVGYTRTYAAPAVGYPNVSVDSAPSNPGVTIATTNNASPGVPFIFANGFANGLAGWAGVVGNVQVVPQAAMGPVGGAQGMAAVIGAPLQKATSSSAPQPAYVYDTTPDNEVIYHASFYFNPNGTSSGDNPVDIFTGLDQNYLQIFGVQFQTEEADSYEIRGWVLHDGERVFTDWFDITNDPHKIEVAWLSGANAGFSLFVDNFLVKTLTGNTRGYQLDEVLLGPSMGLSEGTSGTMYFDEFISNRLRAVQYNFYLPTVNR